MMRIDGKIVNQKVHRVLAETYIENPNHYKYVIHKNGKKTDNTLLNISWSKTAYKEGIILNRNHLKTKKKRSIKSCPICTNEFLVIPKRSHFCSVTCANKSKASSAGVASSLKMSKRSKNEILFANNCINYFGKENVLTNTIMFGKFDADIILPSLKIAILWNGPWHYIQIKRKGHNLGQVKNRDLLKIKNFVTNIIKDMGKYSLEKVDLEFNHFIQRLSFINLPQEYYSHLD